MAANSKDPLSEYRAKRSAGRTPEPFGSSSPRSAGTRGQGGLFVVQKHAATRTHYDFRLEQGGVLLSWAVPRGPSLSPDDKRMAIQTEDHPLDYSDFEGVIPAGNYGAGAVIVWDRGRWVPVDGEDDRDAGKLHFELFGHKLRGRFALVRTGKDASRRASSSKQWLLIKKDDGFARRDAELPETSIYSGLTVEELASGAERTRALAERADELGATRAELELGDVQVMLCEPIEGAFSDPDWIYELKYDGYRLLAEARDGRARLRYRRGMDATRLYPEVARAVAALPIPSVILDGEVVLFDAGGRTDFGLLQERAMLSRSRDIDAAAVRTPAHMVVFDVLELAGRDVRDVPLVRRKELLREILPAAGPLRYVDHVDEEGEAFLALVADRHLEGIVCKRATSTYQGRRSSDWRKVRLEQVGEFAVIGYARSKAASRAGFRSLHLAVVEDGQWVYAGAVGSGFRENDLEAIGHVLEGATAAEYGFDELAKGKGQENVWIEPELVVRVRYLEWREGRLLRQPVFLERVPDLTPQQCRRKRVGADEPPPAPAAEGDAPAAPRVRISNPDKVFWPEDGYTKADLVGYYRAVYPWLRRYLEDRPLVLTRYPDGIHGKSFFQKDAPEWVPDWIRTETVWSEHGERDIHYFVCESEDAIAYLANLGTIPLHVWSSRTRSLAAPDWCILDLDPKEAPFADVVTCARAIKKLCDEIGLPTYVKTSGSTGLHVLIPLAAQCTYEQSRTLAHLLARVIEDEHGDIATTTRNPARRGGKVYLDFVQNGHGRLLVAPLSVRPLPNAPVSMPLRWPEVKPSLDIRRYTMANAVTRLKRMKDDPLAGVLRDQPDLIAALERLSERMNAG